MYIYIYISIWYGSYGLFPKQLNSHGSRQVGRLSGAHGPHQSAVPTAMRAATSSGDQRSVVLTMLSRVVLREIVYYYELLGLKHENLSGRVNVIMTY